MSETDQQVCYQMGLADGAQDRAAGVKLMVDQSPACTETVCTAVSYVERGVLTIVVGVGGGAKPSCGLAYTDGYRGVPFQQH